MSFNKVILQGNLVRENELSYLSSGTAVCKNTIAITEKYKTKNGEQKEDTFFGNFVIFLGAETFAKYTKKGSKVLLDGKLKTEQWEKDGKKQSTTKIIVDNFVFLDSKPEAEPKPKQQQKQIKQEMYCETDDEVPF